MPSAHRLVRAALSAAVLLFPGETPRSVRAGRRRARLVFLSGILELHRAPRRVPAAAPPPIAAGQAPLSAAAQEILDFLRRAPEPTKFSLVARALSRDLDGGDFRAARAEVIASGLVYRPYRASRDHRWWPVDRPLPPAP